MHGMTAQETKLVNSLVVAFGDKTFTIGLAADKAGSSAEDCEKLFPKLCALGVLRCPVNDGGMALYQIALEVVLHV